MPMPRRRLLRIWTTLCTFLYFALFASAKTLPIVIDGNHFFYLNGSQFFVRGVAYQNGGARAVRSNVAKPIIDPLSDGSKCVRDIPHLIKLGVNVIRVYALNASSDHSTCMKSFDDAGIYVLADLGDGVEDIFRTQKPTWTHSLEDRFAGLIDSFHEYNNVLGFIVVSEVVTDKNRTAAMPFVKAAIRDMKTYIKMKGYRNIPVGYTGSEDVAVQKVPQYMVCTDPWNNPIIDFYGMTLYTWCGNSTLEASGYQRQIQNFESYPKPVIISEYGCNKPSPRSFMEVSAIYGEKVMTDVFSGAIAYQYYNDSYGFGLVNAIGNTVEETPEFSSLSSQLASNTPSSTLIGKWPPTTRAEIPCPTLDNAWWAGSQFPPIPSKGICTCMLQSLKCIRSSNSTEQDSVDALEIMCGDKEPKPECLGTSGNGTTDRYGAYSICSPAEQHSFVLNQLFFARTNKDNNTAEVCSALHGTIQSSAANESASDACQIILRQAGPQGTGTITSTPSNLPTTIQIKHPMTSSQKSQSGISKGAKAGIITAAVVGVLVFIALGVQIFARRKRRKSAPPNNDSIAQVDEKIAPPDNMLDGGSIVEADSDAIVKAELPETSAAVIAELPGDQEFIELPDKPDYDLEKPNRM